MNSYTKNGTRLSVRPNEIRPGTKENFFRRLVQSYKKRPGVFRAVLFC